MTWITSGCEGSICYKQLKVVIDMNANRLWAQGSRCNEQHRAMGDMSYSGSWAQSSRCYEQLKVVDDMNDLVSHELKPLDVMNH